MLKINRYKNLKVLLKISVLRNLRQADPWGSLTDSLAHITDSGLRRQPCCMVRWWFAVTAEFKVKGAELGFFPFCVSG